MHDDTKRATVKAPRLDGRILRHMMHETIDLLDLSTNHADEACRVTDAAMALTRIDWMLMEIFNWLTAQMGTSGDDNREPLGEPVSIVGINQNALSAGLRDYANTVDRLHTRIKQLDMLIAETVQTTSAKPTARESGVVLNIFGDPIAGEQPNNPVLASRQRLKSAFAMG